MINSFFNENTMFDLIEEIKYVYLSDNRPWVIGYSGGKDSTVVLNLVYKMLKELKKDELIKPVYVVSSDTLVENPLIKEYLKKTIEDISLSARKDDLPIKCKIVNPEASNTFWANIIGRGFPTPRLNGTFRWCTDRLKISPSGFFINDIISKHSSEVVVLLGVRKDESLARKRRIEQREIEGKLLNKHSTTKDAYVYTPIVELTTDDVWDIISDNNYTSSWGGDNRVLIELYSGADSIECPFAGISSKENQSQSCGKSRFGCWVCTVVKEDKSLNGFIRSGHRELIPLAEFRKWLMSIRDVAEYREKKRRDGKVYYTSDGEIGYGPFTWEARQMILRRLLEMQKAVGYELITIDELKAIDEIWDDELDITRNKLVTIYYEVIGEHLPWHNIKKNLYDEYTINKLYEFADELDVPNELINNLLFATNKNKHYSNQLKLRQSLEKVMSQQWIHIDALEELDYEDR